MKYFENSYKYAAFSGFVSGLYPMLFYCSNNLTMVNSLAHFLYFSLIFLVIPVLISLWLHWMFNALPFLKPYQKHLFFFLPLAVVTVLMNQAVLLRLDWLIIGCSLLVWFALSFMLYKHYPKIIILLGFISAMPLFKLLVATYDHIVPFSSWQALPDHIAAVDLENKPNIYLIQPDGYVSEKVMNSPTYNHASHLYDWLRSKGFTIYDDFRSNYTTSLASNSCLFAMKQHAYEGLLNPQLEIPKARMIISGKNPVLRILKRNGYTTFLLIENEYFQQSVTDFGYDYQNINPSEVPFFSNGVTIRRNVFADMKEKMEIDVLGPKFFFIQRLIPHHLQFDIKENQVEAERQWYADRVEFANNWIEKTVTYIEEKDPNALIVILADHGGWVGLTSYDALWRAAGATHLASIYSALGAIKWNGHNNNKGWDDKYIKSSVNVFRVLFSILSGQEALLDHLEDNASYNLSAVKMYRRQVRRVLDDRGDVVP